MKTLIASLFIVALSSFASEITKVDPATAAEEDAPNMVLSAETNSMKSGVWINSPDHVLVVQDDKIISEADLVVLNTSTNHIGFWMYWPSSNLGYEIKLVDDKEREVVKTKYGKMFGRPLKAEPDNKPAVDSGKYGLHIMGIAPKGYVQCGHGEFDIVKFLPKCFDLEKPGKYKLILINHIYVSENGPNGYFLKRVSFSPVEVNVRVVSIGNK